MGKEGLLRCCCGDPGERLGWEEWSDSAGEQVKPDLSL